MAGWRDMIGDIPSESTGNWRPQGDYALVHPTGWTIAKYVVLSRWCYLLWEPVDRCGVTKANALHGPFSDVRDAMKMHRMFALPMTVGMQNVEE